MVLVRNTFKVKFGHMDAVLAILREGDERSLGLGTEHMILTDASGEMFTLIIEYKEESIGAHHARLEEFYGGGDELAELTGRMAQHFESGKREYYNIEWEA